MEANMMDNLKKIYPVAKDYGNLFIQKLNILENGPKTRKMEKESFSIKMEQYMMDNGLTINHKIKDKLFT